MARPFRDSYSETELRTLVEEYEELGLLREKLWILVRLIDLERALNHLPPRELEAVIFYGMTGLPLRDVADMMCVSHTAIHNRYQRGLKYMARYLNGG
ncbi:MAG TPA: sigma factor-like helix-turn-helix DNA-binding protein [Candidatus Paceibacterota bacterium]